MRSFLIRSLVAVIAIPALLWFFYVDYVWLGLFVAALIALGSLEAWRLCGKAGAPFSLVTAVILSALVPWLSGQFWPYLIWPVWLTLVFLVSATPVLWAHDGKQTVLGMAGQVVSVFWIGIGFSSLLALRGFGDGQGFRWLVFLFTNLWLGDTAAYVFGAWLGKARLAPLISPKKTIAGMVAQCLTSVALGITFVLIGWIDADPSILVVGSLMIAVVGQLGDLFESALKRVAGVKDSSAVIPGHGGVLDRFDSALFAAPALYSLLTIWPN